MTGFRTVFQAVANGSGVYGGCVVGSDDDVNRSLCMLEFRKVMLLPGQVCTERWNECVLQYGVRGPLCKGYEGS